MTGFPGEWRAKKNRIEKTRSGIALFIRRKIQLTGNAAVLAVVTMTVQAGLLTSGSSYKLRLPNHYEISDMMQCSSPVTAAGPSSNCTRFPFRFRKTPEHFGIEPISSNLSRIF